MTDELCVDVHARRFIGGNDGDGNVERTKLGGAKRSE